MTYNGQSASKRSETTYDFLMGNDDVVVKVELASYVECTKDGFANYLSSNPKTLAKNNGEVDLSINLNASYMTILDWSIRSTNQAVIPGASVNKYSSLDETGAISAQKQTGSASTVIIGLTITIDTDKINYGTTYLLIDLTNGNSSSQKASLVIPITVADTIVTEKWQETLIFDVSALSRVSGIYGFNVHLSDQDYVSGSDNKDYQKFENLTATANKVTVTVEYVPGHRYYVSFEVLTDSSISFYKLGDSVGQGSTSTGFNQLKDGLLTFISNGSSLTITVLNETIN